MKKMLFPASHLPWVVQSDSHEHIWYFLSLIPDKFCNNQPSLSFLLNYTTNFNEPKFFTFSFLVVHDIKFLFLPVLIMNNMNLLHSETYDKIFNVLVTYSWQRKMLDMDAFIFLQKQNNDLNLAKPSDAMIEW